MDSLRIYPRFLLSVVLVGTTWQNGEALNPAVIPDILYLNGKPAGVPTFLWNQIANGQAPPFNPRNPNVTEHYAWKFVEMIEKTDNSTFSAPCFNDLNNWLQDLLTGFLYAAKSKLA